MKAILTFHSIDDRGTVLSYPAALFEDLVAGLLSQGIEICSLDQLLLAETDKAVAITFDDGMQSVFTNARPVLAEAGVPSHLYLTTGFVGGRNNWPSQPAAAPEFEMMDWGQLESCAKAGMLMECHTVNHPDLRQLGDAEIEDECLGASAVIEQRFGRSPEHFAYPYGAYDQRSVGIASKLYKSAVTTQLQPLKRWHDTAELPRLDSYYLQKPWLYKGLDSLSVKSYLEGRHLLRKLKALF